MVIVKRGSLFDWKAQTLVNEAAVLREVMAWKQKRRPALYEKQVALAIRYLNIQNWPDATFSEDLPISQEDVLHV